MFTDLFVVNAAYDGAWDVLKYSQYASSFEEASARSKPVYAQDSCRITFVSGSTQFVVSIGIQQGELRQIQVKNMVSRTLT